MVAVLGILQVILHLYTASIDANDPTYYSFSAKTELLHGLVLVSLVVLRGPGGRGMEVSIWSTMEIDFVVSSERGEWDLSAAFHQELSTLAKVIVGRRSRPMCNFIACTNFNPDFSKMAYFQTSVPN